MITKKDSQSSALDALLSEESDEHEGEGMPKEGVVAEKPKGDPSAIVAKIQAELDRLSALLS